jgi:uncharacterized membrane-anchored protein
VSQNVKERKYIGRAEKYRNNPNRRKYRKRAKRESSKNSKKENADDKIIVNVRYANWDSNEGIKYFSVRKFSVFKV